MKRLPYIVGEVRGNFKILKLLDKKRLLVECPICKIQKEIHAANLYNVCSCYDIHKPKGRASGNVYENPPEKLESIKEKYKNGITKEILEEWLNAK